MKRAFATLLASAAAVIAAPAAAQNCDRQCLIELADAYADALIADEPRAVQWSPNAVVVENLAPIAAGAGAFDTITGEGGDDYALHIADPVSGQVGLLKMMAEGDAPVFVGIRLRLDPNGAIWEAEHLIARDLSAGQLANLQTPRPQLLMEVPEAYRDSRPRMLWLGRSYYDALDRNNSNFSNMADDCVRHENGFQTARNSFQRPGQVFTDSEFAYLGGLGCAAQIDTNMWEYIDTIANRRVPIADPVTGLVWGMGHFHHDMAEETTPLVGVPWVGGA